MSSTSNGTITLKAFSDLAKHLDLDSLPPGPPDAGETDTSGEVSSADSGTLQSTIASNSTPTAPTPAAPVLEPAAPQDLAGLIARLASVSSSLETAAREDARARE